MVVQTDLFTATTQYLWQSSTQKVFYFARFINTAIAAFIYSANSLHEREICSSAYSEEGIDPWGR
jgi:hypothetical protein